MMYRHVIPLAPQLQIQKTLSGSMVIISADPFKYGPDWCLIRPCRRKLDRLGRAIPSLGNPPEFTHWNWSQNILRHIQATLAIAAEAPLKSILFEFGHVDEVEALRKFQRKSCNKQIHTFFSIRPLTTNM